MENELYQYLKSLSNKQLIKIAEDPDDYTAEALLTIREIITSRRISADEEQAIRKELMTDVFEEYRKQQQFEEKWKPFVALYHLVRQPSLVKQDNYFLFLLMLLLSAYYLVFLYDRLSFLYFEIRNLQLGGLFFAAVNFIQLISTPVVINLLYRKQISGWILPALGKTIEGVNLLFFILLYFGRFYYFNWRGKLTVSVYLLLVTIILLLLNHKKTRRILNVSTSTQSRTLIGGIIIGIVYYLILRKIYRY
jgi:hypothetical protein